MIGIKVARVQPGPATEREQRVQGRKREKEEKKKLIFVFDDIYLFISVILCPLLLLLLPLPSILCFLTVEKLYGPLYIVVRPWIQLIRALRTVNAHGRSATTVGKWEDGISARGIRHASRFWQSEDWPCFLIKTEYFLWQ